MFYLEIQNRFSPIPKEVCSYAFAKQVKDSPPNQPKCFFGISFPAMPLTELLAKNLPDNLNSDKIIVNPDHHSNPVISTYFLQTTVNYK